METACRNHAEKKKVSRSICLYIDSRPESKGELLLVTDEMTGEILNYKIKMVTANETSGFTTESKISYKNQIDQNQNPVIPNYFGEFISDAKSIAVYGVSSKTRYLTSCSYALKTTPTKNLGLPMNFDYAASRQMTSVELVKGWCMQKVIKSLQDARLASDHSMGYGFPGITNQESYMKVLRDASCDQIDDDVIKVPFYDVFSDNLRKKWKPTLREDGSVGIYRGGLGTGGLYIIVENALPYFFCDQMRVLFEKNPNDLTWEQWIQSDELKRAVRLSIETANQVTQRVIKELKKNGQWDETKTKTKTMTLVSNQLWFDNNTPFYDSGIIRGELDPEVTKGIGGALVRVEKEGKRSYLWLRRVDIANARGLKSRIVIPTSVTDVASVHAITHNLDGAIVSDELCDIET
jgi:hypothetical protein